MFTIFWSQLFKLYFGKSAKFAQFMAAGAKPDGFVATGTENTIFTTEH